MIYQKEIREKAREWKVTPNTVDKDYVLGHFLFCFYNFQNNKDLFVFKGGTCLRKCYFSNYRFSEDLDFTLLENNIELNEEWLLEIIKICSQQSGIQFQLTNFEEKRFKDVKKGYQAVIAFWGANHNQNLPPPPTERWHTKIELDFSLDETVLFPINYLSIKHHYSDADKFSSFNIPVYSLEEVLTEKVRAFYQRSYKAPRDFYDVWYLLNHHQFKNWSQIKETLLIKCKMKEITIDKEIFNDLKAYNTVKRSWARSLDHHLAVDSLITVDEVWEYLKNNLFKNIFNQ